MCLVLANEIVSNRVERDHVHVVLEIQTALPKSLIASHAPDFMQPAFDRYRESYPRRSELHQAIRPASIVLLLRHRVVEFSVVQQQTTLRRNAGNVLVTMMPADIARGIGVTRMEQLGRGVIKAADIEH
jgi:hypothetical protein